MASERKVLNLKMPDFPEPTTLPRLPSYESMMAPDFDREDDLKPAQMPAAERGEKPLFIKMDKYDKVVSSINLIKEKINEARNVLNDVRAIKEEEDAKLQKWHDDLEQIKENLLNVDSLLGESLK